MGRHASKLDRLIAKGQLGGVVEGEERVSGVPCGCRVIRLPHNGRDPLPTNPLKCQRCGRVVIEIYLEEDETQSEVAGGLGVG